MFNGMLGEALARARRMRSDAGWKATGKMPKATPEQRKARNEAYNLLKTKHGFSEFSLQKQAEKMRDDSWIGDHLGSSDTQTISKRAFTAVADWVYGERGRPRRKRQYDMHSIEGKTNAAVIRYREGKVLWDGLELPMLFNSKDKDKWQAQALACKTKYVRVVRKAGKHPWSVQLVQEGLPPERNLPRAKEGTGCMDLGPQVAAVVLPTVAALLTLAPKVQDKEDEITRIQRAMDRSRRATNPNNYKADGTVKRGCKWVKSRQYLQLQDQLRGIKAKAAAEVKRSHGETVNQIRAQVVHFKAEKISYKAWQQRFGKSVNRRSPGALVARCRQVFAATGGTFTEFKTQTTRLSQYDHTTDDYVKKPLSLRVHNFRDAKTKPVQRDLYSAFLGVHVENDLLDTCQVRSAWPGAEPLLAQPVSSLPTIHKLKFPRGGSPVETRRSGSAVEDNGMQRPAPVAPPAGKTADPTGKSVATAQTKGKPKGSESPRL